MVESKVLSLFLRAFPAQRDLLDLFLFHDALPQDAMARLAQKRIVLGLSDASVAGRLDSLDKNREVHARALRMILDSQVDEAARRTIDAGGGPQAVFEAAMDVVRKSMAVSRGAQP
jgi:hypothetical protein